MSGPAEPHDPARDPSCDHGVTHALPTLEFNSWNAVTRHGGCAVLPWRTQQRQALPTLALTTSALTTIAKETGAAVSARMVAHAEDAGAGWAQAVVRITKGQTAVWADCHAAARALSPGGRLVVVGENAMGIAAWQKRAAAWGAVEALVQRAHQRVFAITDPVVPPPPESAAVALLPDDLSGSQSGRPSACIHSQPGLFSAGELDRGTAFLQRFIFADQTDEGSASTTVAPLGVEHVLDIGCGSGHLGLACLYVWPAVQGLLIDADARAVACAQRNAEALGLNDRARICWADHCDAWEGPAADLALCNPPAHAGLRTATDNAVVLLRRGFAALRPGGRLLAVANRQLAYERAVPDCSDGASIVAEADGFKILEWRRG